MSIKRIIWIFCLVLTGIFPAPRSSFSVMHISNSSLRFECIYCHPEGVDGGLPKTLCIDCHKNSSGSNHNDLDTIEVAPHSSGFTSDKNGVWERECVDCHDPHSPNGINISDGISDASYVSMDLIANQAVTDPVTLTTTFTTMEIGTINDPAWADPATWGEKTSPERGLLFVWYNTALGKYYWYEVISATATTITNANASTNHDDAGWNDPKPYFDVEVDCVTCHANDVPTIHGNDCSTCHPPPSYHTLGTWSGDCQRGGCHTVYHEDSIMAYWPFENLYDPGTTAISAIIRASRWWCRKIA